MGWWGPNTQNIHEFKAQIGPTRTTGIIKAQAYPYKPNCLFCTGDARSAPKTRALNRGSGPCGNSLQNEANQTEIFGAQVRPKWSKVRREWRCLAFFTSDKTEKTKTLEKANSKAIPRWDQHLQKAHAHAPVTSRDLGLGDCRVKSSTSNNDRSSRVHQY